ncbi:DUF317 domain-containing protein [Kitasatospora sp. NA04385]|uniref:DUF317 domain-containing protein n=1 Tax=Kitasatospora sp. NA04385 TaxID=2742135 RepID=UPI001591143D|nr:DUF317 domain-containing protein [Kitasatospora sp. NA04385]QKW20650.1 DUF317 domain-containing protein [Kitasatospora sp. NA04385]
MEQTSVTSPDQRLRLTSNRLDPDTRWRISAAPEATAPPLWTAAFSAQTPEELVTATAHTLPLLPEHNRRPGGQDAFDGDAFLDSLIATGWRGLSEPHGVRHAVSPDYLAHAFLRRAADPLDLGAGCALTVTVGPDQHDPYWQARFTTNTPDQVTSAFARALTDPAPLRRDPERMDERLLAHAGYTITETGLTPLPPAHTDEDLTRAAAQALTSLLTSADGYLTVEEAVECLADFPLASRQGRTTWGELPGEQQHLAAMLTLDLVMDSARYSHQLLGLTDRPHQQVWKEQTRGAVPALPLGELRFGNEDLWSAASLIAAEMIATVDDPSGILEGIGDHIASRAVEGTRWHDLPDHLWQSASDEICRRFTALGDKAGELFAPGSPRSAPLVEAAPPHLAGRGHLAATAPAAPLLAAGWTLADTRSTTYVSPCGRISTTETTYANGSVWRTAYTDPSTRQPLWEFCADRQTPAEMTTAVHQALATTYATAPADLHHSTPSGGLEPLAEAGWGQDSVDGHTMWTSPDGGTAMVDHTSNLPRAQSGAPGWLITGGDVSPDVRTGWTIEMTDLVPRPLRTALATALTRTEPVARLARQVPAAHMVDLTITPLKPRPTASVDRATAARHRSVDADTVRADAAGAPEQHHLPHRGRQR